MDSNIGNAVRLALLTQRHVAAPTRKERSALEAAIVTSIILTLTYVTVWFVDELQAYAERPVPEPYVVQDWHPPIDKCPKDINLWACVKNAEYAKNDD